MCNFNAPAIAKCGWWRGVKEAERKKNRKKENKGIKKFRAHEEENRLEFLTGRIRSKEKYNIMLLLMRKRKEDLERDVSSIIEKKNDTNRENEENGNIWPVKH